MQRLSLAQEKQIFMSANVLYDGYYAKSMTGLNYAMFLQIAHIYSFFDAYELNNRAGQVSLQDVLHAQQDNLLDMRSARDFGIY